MATEYDDGVFTTAAQHGDLRIERPLYDKGDTTHIVIYRTMRVEKDSYTPVARGTALAGYAGTRLVRETELTPVSADVSEYTQIYATVPSTRTDEFSGSGTFPFPAYREYTGVVISGFDQYINNTSNTNPAPLYTTYQYWYIGESPTPTVPEVFKPTLDGNPVDFVRDTSLVLPTATVPDASTYAGWVASGTKVVTGVSISEYMGDIIVMQTTKMAAQ